MQPSEKDQYPSALVLGFLRRLAWTISKAAWFIRFTNRENIPSPGGGAFLIVANHQTYIDPVWISIPIRAPQRFMAWDEAFDWPIVGRMMRYCGAFPVSLEVGGTVTAMKAALRALRDGSALMIFPEGGREAADGEFLPFKTGAVRIALQAGVPILPVTIIGGNRVWPPGVRLPRPFRRVEIVYHPPVTVTERADTDQRENLEYWTQKIEEIIASGYGR